MTDHKPEFGAEVEGVANAIDPKDQKESSDETIIEDGEQLTPRALRQRIEIGEKFGVDLSLGVTLRPASGANSGDSKSKVRRKRRSNPDKFFASMDDNFIGRDDLKDDVYIYEATDVLVQKTLEIPMLAQWPNAQVEYEFSSSPSQVKFAVAFVAALHEDQSEYDLEVEEVVQSSVVDTNDSSSRKKLASMTYASNVNEETLSGQDMRKSFMRGNTGSNKLPVRGSFTLQHEGALFFTFDIDDEWWLSSIFAQEIRVSYRIVLHVPSFTYADYERTRISSAMLADNVESTALSFGQFYDCESAVTALVDQIRRMEERAEYIRRRLEKKKRQHDKLEEIEVKSLRALKDGYSRMNGLCIRMLSRHLLMITLGFLLSPGINEKSKLDTESLSACGLVCKYWNQSVLSIVSFGVPSEFGSQGLVKASKSIQLPDYQGERLIKAAAAFTTGISDANMIALEYDTGDESPKDEDSKGSDDNKRNVDNDQTQEMNTISEKKLQNSNKKAEKYGKESTTAENLEIRLAAYKLDKQRRRERRERLAANLDAEEEKAGETSGAIRPAPKISFTRKGELRAQLDRVHKLFEEKRRIKGVIKLWIENFEFKYERQPTTAEKKELIGRYFEEYANLSKKYKIRLRAMQQELQKDGLTTDDIRKWYKEDDEEED